MDSSKNPERENLMAIGIDPTVDYAFKRMLGSPEHTAITIHFINSVLSCDPPIVEVDLLNPFLEQETEEDKLAILDIRARDDQGRWLNIEMQTSLPGSLPDRLTYYVSSLYAEQLQQGEQYGDLRPAVTICVLDQVLFPWVPDPHLRFMLHEPNHRLLLTDHLQVHLMELPKYNCEKEELAHATPLQMWFYFLRNATNLDREEIERLLPDIPFLEAAGVLEMIARSPRERELYKARLKLARDEEARLRGAREAGWSEGAAEGRKEGRKEGVERGRLFGRIELLQQLLERPITSVEDLQAMSTSDLQQRLEALQAELRSREST